MGHVAHGAVFGFSSGSVCDVSIWEQMCVADGEVKLKVRYFTPCHLPGGQQNGFQSVAIGLTNSNIIIIFITIIQ